MWHFFYIGKPGIWTDWGPWSAECWNELSNSDNQTKLRERKRNCTAEFGGHCTPLNGEIYDLDYEQLRKCEKGNTKKNLNQSEYWIHRTINGHLPPTCYKSNANAFIRLPTEPGTCCNPEVWHKPGGYVICICCIEPNKQFIGN